MIVLISVYVFIDLFHHIHHVKCSMLNLPLCVCRVNLYELIKKNNFQGFSQALVRRFAYSLLKCLQMLHKEKIIHCDLKPVGTLSNTI